MIRRIFTTLAAFAALAGAARAQADYPSHQVNVIVPFTAGGATDLLGRLTAETLQKALKQNFIVDNRTGAGGVIGYTATARAAPDGYTLLFAPTAFSIVPYTTKGITYDPRKDFKPISLVAYTANVMVVPPGSKANTVREFIDLAKASTKGLTYASPGVGTPTQLGVEVFARQAGVKLTHVPYRGVTEAMKDLLSGDIDMMFADLPAAVPLMQDGRLKVLGALTKDRHPALPNIPTVAETLPGFWLMGWQGLFAPGGTPDAVIDRLNAPLVAYLKTPEAAERMRKIGVDVAWTTPQEMREWVGSQLEWWGKVAHDAGITPQ
jgi:tripartite-type tricarboxylate transporter receptor subunit TctC